MGCYLPFSSQSKHLWSNNNKQPDVIPAATNPARILAEIVHCPQQGPALTSFYNASVTYRKSNESVVEKTEEDDGTHHHAAYETKGPAGPQDGVNLGHKDGSQSPSPASRCCQPAHVNTLQTVTNVTHVSFLSLSVISNSIQTDLRCGSEDFGVQRVGHDVARWVSHTDQDVG